MSRNWTYTIENLFYCHDYQALVRNVGTVVCEGNGAIIIPSTASEIIRDSLNSPLITVVELAYNDYGYKLEDLVLICSQVKVAALYLTPDLTYDTSEELRGLISLQLKYQFKIIIDDRHRPWFDNNKLLFLDVWADIIDAMIYIEPLSYYIEQLSRFNIITASTAVIEQVQLMAKKNGIQAYFPEAVAANSLLASKIYKEVALAVNDDIKALRELVDEVFSSDFWEAQPVRLNTTTTFYFKAKHGELDRDTFPKLKSVKIHIPDPTCYNVKNTTLMGSRAEFGSLIGKKIRKPQLVKFEKEMRKLVLVDQIGPQ